MEAFFPGIMDSARTKESYSRLKQRTLLVLRLIQGEDVDGDLKQIDDFLITSSRPKLFAGKYGQEVKYIKDFEQTCIILNQHIPKDPKTMTVLEFFQALETVRDTMNRQRKVNGRTRKKPA